MITAAACRAAFGEPSKNNKCMVLWDVPAELEVGVIPKRIYCNKLMVEPLTRVFRGIIAAGLTDKLHTWDGCFNIRLKRNGQTMSLHSWGLAIDINAFENPMGGHPYMDMGIVEIFERNGFVWGGRWKVPDGMHFELANLV